MLLFLIHSLFVLVYSSNEGNNQKKNLKSGNGSDSTYNWESGIQEKYKEICETTAVSEKGSAFLREDMYQEILLKRTKVDDEPMKEQSPKKRYLTHENYAFNESDVSFATKMLKDINTRQKYSEQKYNQVDTSSESDRVFGSEDVCLLFLQSSAKNCAEGCSDTENEDQLETMCELFQAEALQKNILGDVEEPRESTKDAPECT